MSTDSINLLFKTKNGAIVTITDLKQNLVYPERQFNKTTWPTCKNINKSKILKNKIDRSNMPAFSKTLYSNS